MVQNIIELKSKIHFVISVTESPTELAIIEKNDYFQVSWTAPLAPVSGYELFYVTAAGDTHSAGNTTDTNLTVSGLSDVCSVFVVAYGGDSTSEHTLPSARSSAVAFNGKDMYRMKHSHVYIFSHSGCMHVCNC